MTSNPVSRRDFLGTSLLAAASAGGIGSTLWLQTVSRAIEPIARSFGAKFKYSLAAYSYRDLLLGDHSKMTLEDFIADCAKFGLEGTELTSYYFPKEITADYLRKLKDLTFRLGLDVSGTAIRNDFCYPSGPDRDRELAHVKRWVDYAEILGAPVIRIVSGDNHGQAREQAHRLAVEGIEECCQYAGQHGVYLALENHGGLTSQVEGMLALIRDVKSPWFAVNLDTGNFHSADLYGDLAKIAPYATNVQVKVTVSGPDGKKQPSDFDRLAAILADAGYRGYIVLEFEEPEDPVSACPRYLEQIRKAFAKRG